ncbi:hypothetical protein ONS96_002079 [Cadophora gregata f. sp. sojae]|nr:hypothetical protein ONS96_002079 [Cadophora gregata f. sp. sojae]
MASYKSGFDPPTRPGDLPRGRRLGAYMQAGAAGSPVKDRREADIAHLSGQMESKRVVVPSTRTPQTGLPRPSMREPSPSTRRPARPERPERPERPKGITASSFGFGRAANKAAAERVQPELKGKSSRNVLRRKPSSISQVSNARSGMERAGSSSPTKWAQTSAEQRPSIDASMRSTEAYNEIFTRTRARAPPVKDSPPIIPELDRYRNRPDNLAPQTRVLADLQPKLSTHDLPPPTPLLSGTPVHSGGSSHHRYSGYSGSGYSGSGYSASPSTRFSESPGPGTYSRDTTPTSMSSQSPGIIAPLKATTPRLRQGSPALSRPPVTSVTRRRAASIPNEGEVGGLVDQHGLPSLRESLTSSSSNSTVKGEGKTKEKKKKKRLSPLPPSPPPRKSSQKFKKSQSEEQESPSKSSQALAKPVMTSAESSPAKSRAVQPSAPAPKLARPPIRPSREGLPDLQTQLGESMAVIQSNLAGINFSPDRRRSALPRSAVTSPPLGPRSRQSSRLPSRNPSPVPVQPSPREATPAPSGLGIIPTLKPQQNPSSSRGTVSRTPSPSLASSKPRFGLFGRRTKTAPELPTVETKEKVLRKGPVAGTGHEGYGRYGPRGRSSSAGGLARARDRSMSGASSSQESVASTRAHDPFLLERMSPVIIAGGGEIIENRNASSELSRSESNTSLLLGRPSMDSKGSSNLGQEVSRTTLWPSALPKEPTKRASAIAIPKGRRPSDSSDDGIGKSSLAFRRSIQNSSSTLNLPRPLKFAGGASPSITSLDASIMSDESQLDKNPEVEKARKLQMTKPKKLEKRPRSPRKWNFFHRSQPNPKPEPRPPLQVTVAKSVPKSAAIPHYAMLDSSDEQQELEAFDLEDILRDADVISLSNEELDLLQFGEIKEDHHPTDDVQFDMVSPLEEEATPIFSSPEPIKLTPEIPQTELHLVKETAPTRPSRLPQVGRIPKVISARPEATSPKSFSRPFARLSTAQPLLLPQVVDKNSVGLGPSPPKPSTPEPVETRLPYYDMEDVSRQSSGESRSESTRASHQDFLAFSPRKNSEATTSSSGGLSLVGITAVIPEADAELEEDEVWDEYDDLIENDDTIKVPVSATSSHGVPFQYESYESRRMRKSKVQAKESPTLTSAPPIKEQVVEVPERRSALTSSSVYSGDMSARLRDALNTIPTPTTPMSFTDFFSGYGDRNNSVHGESAQRPRRGSQSSSRKSTSSSSHSRSISGLRTISEQESSSPISQVNLRVGSMTVSKWLTFGHVLFSPAREEIMQLEGPTKRHSILVIDGLGNDDWSFYAAETYPNSTFYNLSPTRPLSNSQRTSGSTSFPLTPPNHRQIQYLSTSHKFPFPSSTFDVVVFRFPTAMSEASYRNIVAESKRVLKSGGYLEMAILDLDMMNMGNRARRAVRGLKVKMQVADPSISLASASDTVLRIVGKRGFSDIKSCNVGVPVASNIPAASKDTSHRGSTSSKGKEREHGHKEEISLADMMKDESRAGDESITKMVAKVGRWWYTRCYEMAVIPDGDLARSIFNDGSLLSESEKWNASFKLVVAYAQKPVVGRRRTASV